VKKRKKACNSAIKTDIKNLEKLFFRYSLTKYLCQFSGFLVERCGQGDKRKNSTIGII